MDAISRTLPPRVQVSKTPESTITFFTRFTKVAGRQNEHTDYSFRSFDLSRSSRAGTFEEASACKKSQAQTIISCTAAFPPPNLQLPPLRFAPTFPGVILATPTVAAAAAAVAACLSVHTRLFRAHLSLLSLLHLTNPLFNLDYQRPNHQTQAPFPKSLGHPA